VKYLCNCNSARSNSIPNKHQSQRSCSSEYCNTKTEMVRGRHQQFVGIPKAR